MQYCPNCMVQIRGHKARCPLCQRELLSAGSEQEYDDDPFVRLPEPRVSFMLMIRMVTFVCVSLEILLGAAEVISGFSSGWIIAVMLFVLLAWTDFQIAVYYRNNIIRMLTMGIPPLALTGAVFGAFLSGVFYRMSKGKVILAVLGEIIGTGIIGALASYPVMTLLWGKEGLGWLFYVPSFICGTLIGGSIAYVFLRKLASNGMLARMQRSVGSAVYHDRTSALSDALTIAALGGILWVVIKVAGMVFGLESPVLNAAAYIAPAAAAAAGLIYYFCKNKEGQGSKCKH